MDSPARRIGLEFESRAFSLAKDAGYPDENQDCWCVDEVRGVAALADGVSSAIFSRSWAEILVNAAVAGFPDPADAESFARWLAERRAAWSRQIDVSRLAWFQKPKLREGAFSTLLFVRLDAPAEDAGEWRLRGLAIGDTCLFHVREGKLLSRFPVQSAIEFQGDPLVIGSIDLNRDPMLAFCLIDEPCQPGDLVVLCTDALAEWVLRLEESGTLPSWPAYWDMPQAAWAEEIQALRNDRVIRFDDTTLVLLRIAEAASRTPADAVTPAVGLPAADPSWVETVEEISVHVGRQLSDHAARAVKRLKTVSQNARLAIEKYLKNRHSDDHQ
jgi:hypothetical protein